MNATSRASNLSEAGLPEGKLSILLKRAAALPFVNKGFEALSADRTTNLMAIGATLANARQRGEEIAPSIVKHIWEKVLESEPDLKFAKFGARRIDTTLVEMWENLCLPVSSTKTLASSNSTKISSANKDKLTDLRGKLNRTRAAPEA